MSKLNKEECRASLAGLYAMAQITVRNSEELKFAIGNDFDLLTQLINEHFDNPPLKFEELKEGMWVWDRKYKEYKKVYMYDEFEECYWLSVIDSECDEPIYEENFEENRFYRKQVEE